MWRSGNRKGWIEQWKEGISDLGFLGRHGGTCVRDGRIPSGDLPISIRCLNPIGIFLLGGTLPETISMDGKLFIRVRI